MNLVESLIIGKSIDSRYVTRKAVREILISKSEYSFYSSHTSCKLPAAFGTHQPAKEKKINQPNGLPFSKHVLVPVLRDISLNLGKSQLSKPINLSHINKSVFECSVKRSERIKNRLEKQNASLIKFVDCIAHPTTASPKVRKTRLHKNSSFKENVGTVAKNKNSKKNLGISTSQNFEPNSNISKAKYNLRSLNSSVKQIKYTYESNEENEASKRKISTLQESGPIGKKKRKIPEANISTNRKKFTKKNSEEEKSKRKVDDCSFAYQSSHPNEKNCIDISSKIIDPTAHTNDEKIKNFIEKSFQKECASKGSEENLLLSSDEEIHKQKFVKKTDNRKCVKVIKGSKGATGNKPVKKTNTKNEFVEKISTKQNLNLAEAPLSNIIQAKRGTLKYLKERQKILRNELNPDDMDIFDYSFSKKDKGWYALLDEEDDDFLTIKTPKDKTKEAYIGMTPRSALIDEWSNEKPSNIVASAKKIINPKDENIANQVLYHHLKSMKPKNRVKRTSTPLNKKIQNKTSMTAEELPLDLALPSQDIDTSLDDYFNDSV